jgi:hypothetical protein
MFGQLFRYNTYYTRKGIDILKYDTQYIDAVLAICFHSACVQYNDRALYYEDLLFTVFRVSFQQK